MLSPRSLAILALISIASTRALAQTGPAPTLNILTAGAIPDGKTLNTTAIQKAIDTLAAQGGGTLLIPAAPNPFLTGALFLKPHVNLRLEKGAILKGSPDIKDYPLRLTRIEGHSQQWVPALINAEGCDHLQIDGMGGDTAGGTLDGSGRIFYDAYNSAHRTTPATKNLDIPRPRLLYIAQSKDVSIAGIHLLNSGFWNLHLYRCDGVSIDALDIQAPADSPSTDGIDIDSSRNVTITNTTIANHDDCIALKGSKGVDAPDDKDSPPVEHIRISHCTITRGASLLTCGSEATFVRDVTVEHCTVSGPNTAGIAVLRLELRPDTPQTYEDIHFNDITLDATGGGNAGTLINIAPWSQYETIPPGRARPAHTVQNISLTNIRGTFGSFGTITSATNNNLPLDTLQKITLENIDLQLTTPAPKFTNLHELTVKNVKINGSDYLPPAALTQPAPPSTPPTPK